MTGLFAVSGVGAAGILTYSSLKLPFWQNYVYYFLLVESLLFFQYLNIIPDSIQELSNDR